ncbi:hypothetical protein I3760_02G057900 [Carya illinoinensis]|nr:hypothetical protein I3760_02G057900 [Carya illinoinensis]
MGSLTAEKPKRSNSKNPKLKQKPLGPKRAKTKLKSKKKKRDKNEAELIQNIQSSHENNEEAHPASAAKRPLCFFLDQFQSANGVQLSSLELESIKDTSIVELSQDATQDVLNLGKHMKAAFGSSWKEELCGKQLSEGKVNPGCPALLIVSSSALRSIELLRGFRSLTKDCHAVKLFSKHMKVEEQVVSLSHLYFSVPI